MVMTAPVSFHVLNLLTDLVSVSQERRCCRDFVYKLLWKLRELEL